MNEVIQINGQCVGSELSGTIECCRVVIIPGKLINVVTSPPDPNNFIRFTELEDGTKLVEGKGQAYEQYASIINEQSKSKQLPISTSLS